MPAQLRLGARSAGPTIGIMHQRRERTGPEPSAPRTPAAVPASPFGRWHGAGNRAIAGLLSPSVQRDEAVGATGAGQADAASPAADDTSRVDDMANAILGTVDGAAVADQLRRDAAAQGGVAAAAASGSDSVQTARDAPRTVQTARGDRATVQRDDPATPPTTKSADVSNLLDAILALPTVKALIDRLAEIAAREVKKAGAPATITLGAFVIPPLLVGLNQGLGVKKLVLKTPEISLGRDAQGVQRSLRFRFDATVDPNSGGGGSIGAEFRF